MPFKASFPANHLVNSILTVCASPIYRHTTYRLYCLVENLVGQESVLIMLPLLQRENITECINSFLMAVSGIIFH